jgi:hypothetical protein
MRFGTRIVRGLCRSGSLTAAATELSSYKLDLVGVQEVRWDKVGTVSSGDYISFYGRRNENFELGTQYLYTTELYQQLKEWCLLVKGCHI